MLFRLNHFPAVGQDIGHLSRKGVHGTPLHAPLGGHVGQGRCPGVRGKADLFPGITDFSAAGHGVDHAPVFADFEPYFSSLTKD